MSTWSGLFTTVLNMSITASYVAFGVILVRLLLKKAPKIFSYALWAVVLFRLLCPLSFTSAVSFLGLLHVAPQNTAGVLEYVPPNIAFMPEPTVQSGIGSLDSAVNTALPSATPIASVNPMQVWIDVLSLIWLAGIMILVLYSVISYIKIKRQLQTATLVKDNIYESDRIGTAFVCGFIQPKIYVPVGVADADLAYILEHERTHIRRYDYLIKPLAFFALILHWFNPIMWLSFALMSRDMEMSCDERVLHQMNPEAKGDYSSSLLALSVKSNGLFAANPLAFGESHVKARIKNVLNYKKPRFWVMVLAVMATAVLMVAFSTNPQQEPPISNLYEGYSIDTLMDNKTPYAGNNVKVTGLIGAMPLPAGIIRDTVELQTDYLPYGITINYIMNDSYNVLLVNGAINGEAFYRNAIILFSLIDNVDVINCKIADKTGQHEGALYTFTYTREMTEELIGKDVRPLAASADTLKDLIDRVNNTPLGSNLASPLTANSQIEEYLEIIICSPGASSNPRDYIEAHQYEYDAIIKMDAEALPYLFSEFEKGGQTGLKGHIMESLCRNILGGEDISYANTDPQDWYDTYKAHMLSILEKNSLEFIRSNNPKGSIVLNNAAYIRVSRIYVYGDPIPSPARNGKLPTPVSYLSLKRGN